MTRHKQSSGQAYVITILFLAVLLAWPRPCSTSAPGTGPTAALQATVDAAALAGAQALPDRYGRSLGAGQRSTPTKNGGGDDERSPSRVAGLPGRHDHRERIAPGARASSRRSSASTPSPCTRTRRRAPATRRRPSGSSRSSWTRSIRSSSATRTRAPARPTLVYQHFKANGSPNGAGNFGFINLTGGRQRDERPRRPGSRTAGTSTWASATTTRSRETCSARRTSATTLDARIGDVLLFPIYRKLTGNGTNAKYEIVGWAGFRLTGIDLHGSNEKSLRRVRECHLGRHSSRQGERRAVRTSA